ncbi:MAG: NADH-quinone oxidoreductase subunit N [Actinobacteria bacterium]|nr:NADH-quinone oxidoreductase subunit N [Actinomycetota bacterium]
MRIGHVLPQIVLLVGAATTLVVALVLPRRRQSWSGAVALAALAGTAGAQLSLVATSDQLTFDLLWALDASTHVASILVCAITAVAVLLAREWMVTDPRFGEYHALLLLGALGAIVMAGAADANELVVGVTLSSVTGYTLAAYHRRSALSVEAGMGYFLIGGLSNIVLLVGVVLLFAAAGTTLYADLPGSLAAADPWLLAGAAVGLPVGLAFKVGAVPGHGWVPDVAQGAPLPSAAFLTVVPKVGGVLALARLVDLVPASSRATTAVAVLAALSMTLGNLAALRQEDVRRLLGWSSVSQAGYALMGVAAVQGSDQAVPALLLFLVVYAVANTAAFAVVGLLRGRTRLEDFAGLVSVRPWPAWALTIALLSLVGIPPLAGFAGKFALFTATIDADLAWLAALAVVNTVVSLFYYLRVIAACHLREPPAETVALLGRWSTAAVALAVAGTVVLGLAGGVVLGTAQARPLLP